MVLTSTSFLAICAFFIIPLSLNTKFIVIPAKISKITIVTTSAINVIPILACFNFFTFIFYFPPNLM